MEGGVKGLYCRYRLKGDEFVNRTRIIPPLVNGFASDLRTSSHDPTQNLVYYNAQAFQIINVNQDRDSVPIVMNPVLADLVIDTQDFLLNAGDAGWSFGHGSKDSLDGKTSLCALPCDASMAEIMCCGRDAHIREW